ncbi:hypothetical protein VB773_20980 [Haloarculaceae archaeon H-GB2-1]|nr:hypothetical protein [Haloarculaceae archaeon H-GB2-1]
MDEDAIPEPVVAPSVPVDIAPDYFASTRDRVTELLADLPTPFGPDDVPNGHVREHLTDAADTATDGLDDARTARTGMVAIHSLRKARAHARYATAGWAVADEGLSLLPSAGNTDRSSPTLGLSGRTTNTSGPIPSGRRSSTPASKDRWNECSTADGPTFATKGNS